MKKMYLITLFALLLAACGSTGKSEPEGTSSTPSAPDGLVIHGETTETTLIFKWNVVSGATSYEWTLTQAGEEVKNGATKNRSAIVDGLSKATDYRFGVKAVSAAGASAYTWIDARTAGESEEEDPDSHASAETYAKLGIPQAEEDGVARAFPGAQGGGMYTTGGRGGKVYHVTNLNDSGEGSLRYGIKGFKENGKLVRPLTIVFDVAGIIELASDLKIEKGKEDNGEGDITIAGQTAPGDGICLKNYTLRINANNVIIRFIRCRMGDEKSSADDAMNLYTGNNDLSKIIIDHCSLSWSTDECGTFYGMTDFSLQWCILSESLRNSIHGKGKHGYGGIWGGENATYHHNLLAHHDSRNPRLDHDYVSTLKGPVTLANNVIYNWGADGTYGGESANTDNEYRKYNIVNNYYKPGPATTKDKVRFLNPWIKPCDNCTAKTGCSTIVPGHYYMTGNVMDDNEGLSADNWAGTTASPSQIEEIKAMERFAYAALPTYVCLQSAQDAYTAVLDYAGASIKRDGVDVRVADETRNKTYTYEGSKGSTNGLIDTQTDVGGWPQYSGTPSQDSDGDGMPDWFEEAFGLDKMKASDAFGFFLDAQKRYTNLEMYLHYLVKDIVAGGNAAGEYVIL